MEAPGFETIRVSADGRRGMLLLDRPEHLNPLSITTLYELEDAARWFDRQHDVRVVVVAGAGRAMSSGADLGAFAGPAAAPPDGDAGSLAGGAGGKNGEGDENGTGRGSDEGDDTTADAHQPIRRPPDPRAGREQGGRMAKAIEEMRAVTIARIHGWCVGGGFVLAAACDLRVAATSTRFSIPEVDIGLPLTWGAIPRMVRDIGPALTKELVMTCRPFDAHEAKAIGFLNRVVADDRLVDEVDELADLLASKARYALLATKAHVNAVTESMVGTGRSWADADALAAGFDDPEGRVKAREYLERRRDRGRTRDRPSSPS